MRYTMIAVGLLWAGTLQTLFAQPIATQVDTKNSELSYTGSSFLHDFTGVSRQVTGTLAVDLAQPGRSRIELVVPVESFGSGNSSRDSNMLETVEVDKYPDVRFVSTQVTPGGQGVWTVKGNLTFHGQTHDVEVPVHVAARGNTFEAQGSFGVSLTRYKVRRPKLMMKAIEDEITIEFTVRAPLSANASR